MSVMPELCVCVCVCVCDTTDQQGVGRVYQLHMSACAPSLHDAAHDCGLLRVQAACWPVRSGAPNGRSDTDLKKYAGLHFAVQQ